MCQCDNNVNVLNAEVLLVTPLTVNEFWSFEEIRDA